MSISGHGVPRAKHGVSMLSSKLGISLLVPCHSWSQMDVNKVRRRTHACPSCGRRWWWRTGGYRGRSSVEIRDTANTKSIEDGRGNSQSETRACRCRLDAVVPGFLLPTPQGGLWGYGPGDGGKAEAWGKRESNPLRVRCMWKEPGC
ncbi:hypothetical protein B0T13DRAFT_274441 [Neurospora crassa]|nr:hypothetical protein B0T13DRAFT_274441 [Neurospora crassa]